MLSKRQAAGGFLWSAVALFALGVYACEAHAQHASSPIGDGVCVVLGAAVDVPPAMAQQSYETIGGYCSLSGCQLSGQLSFTGTAGGTFPIRLGAISGTQARGVCFYTSNPASCNAYIQYDPPTASYGFFGASNSYFNGNVIIQTGNYFNSASGGNSYNFIASGTGAALASSGDTAANIATKTACAGLGCFHYDTTNACWRTYAGGAWRGCIAQSSTGTDGGASPSNATIFRLASVTTPAGVVDSTMNTILVGQQTSVTARYLTGLVATPGTGGTGRTIQFDCVGIISGKRCLADISCTNNSHGFDGGSAFTVPFFGYGGTDRCSFSNDIVRCLGRNTPVDGGTDCTTDPVMTVNSLAIEGTYP